MTVQAILLGSIGVLCETSAMQRTAFNTAFLEAGLNWQWSETEYNDMLTTPGGARRIADFAEKTGTTVDIDRLHARKSEIFQEMLRHAPLTLRPGVAETIAAAKANGIAVALVTTTSLDNIEAMLSGAPGGLGIGDLAFVGHRGSVDSPKPDPEVYQRALSHLKVAPDQAVAVEDSPESALSSIGAGITTVAFPGAAHAGRAFDGAAATLNTLDFDLISDINRIRRKAA